LSFFKKVLKELGRAASKMGRVVGTIPIPAIGGLASGALDTAGALLQGKSASKYLSKIPQKTLNSLVRGASLLANPAGALESVVNTIGTAQEEFASKIGKVPIRELVAGIKEGYQSGSFGLGSIASLGSSGEYSGEIGGGGYRGGVAAPGLDDVGGLIDRGGQVASSVLPGGSRELLRVVGDAGGRIPQSVRVLLNSSGSLAGFNIRY